MSKIFAYVTSVQPLMVNGSLCFDVFYLTAESSDWHCLRIYNYYLSFMVARFPGMEITDFTALLKKYSKGVKIYQRTDLKDSSYFAFGDNYDYYEIISNDPYKLSAIYDKLYKEAEKYYFEIDVGKLNFKDKVFYEQTETPFRYTSSSCVSYNLGITAYNLSCKYDIPLIGGIEIDKEALTKTYPYDYLPTNHVNVKKNMYGFDANKGLTISKITKQTNYNNEIIKHLRGNDSVDFLNNMTMLSYDIETYTPYDDKGNDLILNDVDIQKAALENRTCEIMCIGIGLFHMKELKPFRRLCIQSHDFDKTSVELLKSKNMIADMKKTYGCKTYIIRSEYTEEGEDLTEYIITNTEVNLLKTYIKVLEEHKPHIISAFNNFGFDDRYVYQRIKNQVAFPVQFEKDKFSDNYYNTLLDKFINTFSPYPVLYVNNNTYKFLTIEEIEQLSDADGDKRLEEEIIHEINFKKDITKIFVPQFKEFTLKIDNEAYEDNKTIRAPHVLNLDIYKLILKEDAKRFTQYGRGNLDSMLEAYHIVNPYTNKQLSKSGMKIPQMFKYWETSSHLYEIALYCMQDAWICGTLLIKKSQIIDLIETAIMSNTTMNDSIYRADSIRVTNCILRYAFHEDFAVMDTPFEYRSDVLAGRNYYILNKGKPNEKHIPFVRLGGKSFDTRTITGGQVRQIQAGREYGVVASDYSAMYPSNKEASNIDSSSRIPDIVIEHPEWFNLEIVREMFIVDMYGPRRIFFFKCLNKLESSQQSQE